MKEAARAVVKQCVSVMENAQKLGHSLGERASGRSLSEGLADAAKSAREVGEQLQHDTLDQSPLPDDFDYSYALRWAPKRVLCCRKISTHLSSSQTQTVCQLSEPTSGPWSS